MTWRFVAILPSRLTIKPLPSVVPALDSPLMSTTAGETFATIDGTSEDDWPFNGTCPGAMAGSIDKAHTIRFRPTRKTLVMKGIRRILIASEWYHPSCASVRRVRIDRKSTRLNSSHLGISYAVFCLKKK